MSNGDQEKLTTASQGNVPGCSLPLDLPGLSPSAKFTSVDILRKYEYIYTDGVFSMHYNHDGQELAVGYGDHGIELIDPANGTLIKELSKHKYGSMGALCVRYNPTLKTKLLVGTTEGVVTLFDTTTGTSKQLAVETSNEINCVDYCADGTKFATAGKDMDIKIYDSRSARRLHIIAGYSTPNTLDDTGGHAQRIFALRFFPGSNDVFITAGWDNNLKIWDCRSPTGVKRIVSGPHLCGDGLDMRGNQILTASWRSRDGLQTWDLDSGKLIETYPLDLTRSQSEHENTGEFLYCARFFKDGALLAGGSGTNSVQVVDVLSKQVIGEIPMEASVQALDTTRDREKQFCCGGMNKELIFATIS